MARRAVMNESAKCRSGRDAERTRRTFPSGRGGEMLHPFGDDEREAAECDRNMMVPAHEGAALVVIETQLFLELLMGLLADPARLD